MRLLQFLADKRVDLIEKIKEANSDEIEKIIIRNEDQQPKLTIGKKAFNLHDQHDSFFNVNVDQVTSERRNVGRKRFVLRLS